MTDLSGVDPGKPNALGIGANEPAISQDADTLAAAKIARGSLHGRDPITVVQIKSDEDYDTLAPGMKFKDPQGNVRIKPYKVSNDDQYDEIPEGAQFLDPEGNIRTKPQYSGLNYTTQTLYDMSTNDTERRKALEHGYPGKVKERGGKLYVDDSGVLRRPKGFGEAPGAALTAGALPTIGSVAGEIVGGGIGTAAEPGGGTLVGAIGGGAAGGAAGQAVNDVVLGLAGVYDRSAASEAGEVGLSAAFSGAGTAIGRGAAAVYPAVKGAVMDAFPKAVNHFLGVDPAAFDTAKSLRAKGVLVPSSTVFKESPHFANLNEVFDPAFRMQKPLLQSATAHYEKTAGEILESLGVKPEGKISEPTAAPSTQKAGEMLLTHRLATQQAADVKLDAALKETEVRAALGSLAQQGKQKAVESAAAESRKAAEALIDSGFQDIQRDVDTAMRTAKSGHNSGDLWQAVGDKLLKIRQGISDRAKVWYAQADKAAGGHLPNSTGLPELALQFLDQLPEPFKAKYPDAVRKLVDLAGTIDANGQIIKPPIEPTFGQLHELRTWFRSNVNWYDLTPDIREGVYKLFAKHVDAVLHDKDAVPELQTAAQLLDATDKWYGEQIRPLQDRNIEAVVKGLESGLPADPKVLFDTLVKEGRTDLTKKVAQLIGPNLWAGVKAADVQQMLEASKTLVPDVIDGNAFVREVLSRYRTGMLEAVHGSEASAKLLKQAQSIAMLDGKLDVHVRPGDKMADVIAKARAAADVAKAMAEKDPLATLTKEMRTIKAEHLRETRADPLAFIYKRTTGAAEAVDHILGDEDLILAAAARFGEQSPEFNMLRQVWAQRILINTIAPGAKLATVSPEVQNLMFPGVTLEQMQTLAKEMDFLTASKALHSGASSGAGPSMSAFEKVENPWGGISGTGKLVKPLQIIPGINAVGRAILGKYFAFATKVVNSPTLYRIVERGLRGDAAGRAQSRQIVQRWMQTGGAIGAGVGQAEFQAPSQ